MRIIGDVHEDYNHYFNLLGDESLQLGDMGFDYSPLPVSEKHKFFPGNHDNPVGHPNCIGRWGQYGEIFYVGGAYSIDKKSRTEGLDWFLTEELNQQEQKECFDKAWQVNPDIIVSHDAPDYICEKMSSPQNLNLLFYYGINPEWRSTTQKFLGTLPRPKLWVFGHWHTSKWFHHEGTDFVCLNMVGRKGSYIDL